MTISRFWTQISSEVKITPPNGGSPGGGNGWGRPPRGGWSGRGNGRGPTNGGGSGGGGGGGIPAEANSITHLVRPNAMTFSGGNLSSITDEVNEDSSYISITGNLPEDTTNGGYQMSEAASGNYVTLDGIFEGSFPSGVHFMIRMKRNGTADDAAMAVGGLTDTIFAGCGQDGSVNTQIGQNHGFSAILINGTEYSSTTRNVVWDEAFGDTVDRGIGFKDFSRGFPMLLGHYTISTFIFEGTILGWARFTDWTQAAAVETFLLSSDPV